jgi:ankyrin repeat protein
MRILALALGVAAALGQQSVADAVMDGDAKAVAALVARGADVNEKDADGITPLMQAASAGRLEILRLLIEAKADVAARNAGGASALTAAAFSGTPMPCNCCSPTRPIRTSRIRRAGRR